MRDRLHYLIKKAEAEFANSMRPVRDVEKFVADYLFENGVIVPPCKVGDTVYFVGKITKQIVSIKVVTISASGNDVYLHLENGSWVSCSQHIGKTVFLTREEAEKALKGGEGDGNL